MNNSQALGTESGAPFFMKLRILMTGEDSVCFRVEGPSVETIALASTSLAGNLDETASAICRVLLRERNLVECSETDAAIDQYLNVDFNPPLTGQVPIRVVSKHTLERATLTVTTTSLGAMVGALFVHFSGAMSRVRDVLISGSSEGVELSTNIRLAWPMKMDAGALES